MGILETAFQNHRKAIELFYDAKCIIYTSESFLKENGATGERKKVLCEDEPCKVSYDKLDNTAQTDTSNNINQQVRLLISPDIDIPEGSLITVTWNGTVMTYRNSGTPARYHSHQEIKLVPEEKRA